VTPEAPSLHVPTEALPTRSFPHDSLSQTQDGEDLLAQATRVWQNGLPWREWRTNPSRQGAFGSP
jgi:hypothetical protein